MRWTYDPTADAAYLYVADTIAFGTVEREVRLEDLAEAAEFSALGAIGLSFGEGDRLLGIEVLSASEILPKGMVSPEVEDVRTVSTRTARQDQIDAIQELLNQAGLTNFRSWDSDGHVTFEVATPGERWAIDVGPDGDVEIQVFSSRSELRGVGALREILTEVDRSPVD